MIKKVITDDISKLADKVVGAYFEGYNKIAHEFLYYLDPEDGHVKITGKGCSEVCRNDVFNAEIGNEIAFRKAKLYTNIKKYNLLHNVWSNLMKTVDVIMEEQQKLEKYIAQDILAIRKYNSDYWSDKYDEYGQFRSKKS